MTYDVVYILGEQDSHEEFRYSLRSLRNLPHGEVWIAGFKPDWVTNVNHIPTVQESGFANRWANSTGNLKAACDHPDVSDVFWFFNDDHIILEPVDTLPVLHRGLVAETHERLEGNPAMAGTYALLQECGIEEPIDYELHIPLLIDKLAMSETIDLGSHIPRLRKRTLYGNLEGIGGEKSRDFTIRHRDDMWEPGQIVVSTHDRFFVDYPAGERIRSLFPDSSRYEKTLTQSREDVQPDGYSSTQNIGD